MNDMKESKFIGFYNYTVWLTYISLLSGFAGIVYSLSANGRPYMGVLCLFFSGLCDTFDGKVARTKKNRSDLEKGFGIQIDSLADMVAFGVLPACIGKSMIHRESRPLWLEYTFLAIMLFYVLAALIRLAYFNVTEEERQKTEKGKRMYYEGLPVTSSALIFPLAMVIQYISGVDLSVFYFIVLFFTGLAFIFRFKVIKPGNKGISGLLAIGAVELAILIFYLLRK